MRDCCGEAATAGGSSLESRQDESMRAIASNLALSATLTLVSSLLAGCSSATGEPGSGGSGGSSPAGATAARCVGQPVEAYTIRDRDSCAAQGSTWDSSSLECRGTTFTVHCSRADESGLSPDGKRAMCLDMPGCGFTETDGSVTHPTGHCEGTKTPCSTLDQATCVMQTGCIWYSSGGCSNLNGAQWLDNVGCAELQLSNTVSYSVVKSACERALGCAWKP